MVNTIAGITFGTLSLVANGTLMQPLSVTSVTNNDVVMYASETQTVHIDNKTKLNMVIETGGNVKEYLGDKSIDVKVKKGHKVYINALTGYSNGAYSVANHDFIVTANYEEK